MSAGKNKAVSHSKHSQTSGVSLSSFLIGFLLALVICLAIAVVILFRKSDRPTDIAMSATARAESALRVDPNAGAQVTPTPVPSVKIPGWLNLTLPKDTLDAPAAFYNPSENSGLYYLTFELMLTETGETVFVTGLIPPGEYCNRIKLNRPLDAGSFPAILHVQPYYMDSLEETNSANMEILLTVE